MIRLRRLRLTPKLTLAFVLFAAALLGFIGALAYYSGRSGLEAATLSALASIATEKQTMLTNWVNERQSDLSVFAASPNNRDILSAFIGSRPGSAEARSAHDRLVGELRANTGRERAFLTLWVMDPVTGQVIAASDAGAEGTFNEDRPYFINGKNGPYVQNPYYSLSLQQVTMTVSVPFRAADGQLLAVLAGQVNLDTMNAIITGRTGLQQTDDAYLVNTSNLFVTQPRLLADPAVLQRGVHTVAVNQCLTRNSGVVFADEYRGIPALVVYRWLPEREMCLIVKIDQDEALEPVKAFGITLAIVGGLALLAAAALAVGLARTLTRPILTLQIGVTRFGQGERDIRLPESHDELGLLTREFNVMAATIAEKERQLRDYASQLQTTNKDLEAFGYSVSHDLRTPLRGIDGYARILLRDYASHIPEDGQRRLQALRDMAQHMGKLIDDLLTFSRLNRQSLQKQSVDISKLVKEVLEDLKDEMAPRQVEIVLGELPDCQADRSLLKQVFINLLSNALKYTRPREVSRIEVGTLTTNSTLVYFVQDNGVGFDMKYVDKLFGVFQRLHRSEEFEGTGVGLAIVQRIINRHGGRVWAEGALDAGARFSSPLKEVLPMMEDSGAEILLVEDNPVDIDLTLDAFAQARLANHMHVVRDGAEAIDFVFCTGQYTDRANRNPKLILLDINLPKVSGLEVLKQIRANSRTRHIPVVILTSSSEERDVFESYELGVNSYIVKPVDFEQFTEAVRTLGFYWFLLNHPPQR